MRSGPLLCVVACRWASGISNSEAGVIMFVFQTLKDESEKLAAREVVIES